MDDESIQQFLQLTGVEDPKLAAFFLESAGGDVSLAVNMYLDGRSTSKKPSKKPSKKKKSRFDDSESGDSEEQQRPTKKQRKETRIEGGEPRSNSSSQNPPDHVDLDDYVRAPIQPKQMRLVDPTPAYHHEQRRRVRPVSDSVFLNLGAFAETDDVEFIMQGAHDPPAQKKLAETFRPPVHLLDRGTLEEVSRKAEEREQYLLINLQDYGVFESCTLNRDVWSNPSVQSLIKRNFTFWQVEASSSSAKPYKQYYTITTFPHIAVLDPRTGERLDFWEGKISAVEMMKQFRSFLDKHPYDPSKQKSTPSTTRQVDLTGAQPVERVNLFDESEEGDSDDLSEESQLAAAIKLSLTESSIKSQENDTAKPGGSQEKPASLSQEVHQSQGGGEAKGQPPSEAPVSEAAENTPLTLRATSVTAPPTAAPLLNPIEAAKKAAELVAALDPQVAKRQCTLQIRLPSNESVTISLLASALLSEVFSRVRGAAPSLADKQFDLLTTFPKRRFSATDINTLAGADLMPRAVLIVEEK